MNLFAIFILSTFAAQIVAVPHAANHVIHERRDTTPKTWAKRDRLDATIELPVRIDMAQRNLDKGYDLLMEVSRHDSPKYGQHFTADEVAEIFAPSQTTVDAGHEWLVSAGIPPVKISQSVNKQWMQFDASTLELESLLKTEYHIYEHTETGKTTVSCKKYHVPAHVQEHVDYVTPGIKLYAQKHRRNPKSAIQRRDYKLPPLLESLGMTLEALLAIPELEACSIAITPVCIKALYNVTTPTKAATGNQLGIFEELRDDVYCQTDLNLFFASFAQHIPQGTGPKLEVIDGAVAPTVVQNAGPESDLDFQVSYPLIYPQNAILFKPMILSTKRIIPSHRRSPSPPYLDPFNAAGAYKGQLKCGVYKPTNVISISYGGSEADLPTTYQQRQGNEFMKLGMQGVSIVLASGDSGVAGPVGNGGNADGCLGRGQIFNPDFPATCPYITTVGATYLPPGASVQSDTETAVTRFGSGGGFSNIYPMPDSQKTAVQVYLTNDPPPYTSYSGANNQGIGAGGGVYNSAGRGYPDISAVGDNIVIYNKGMPTLIGGTSASAPIFTSLLNRIHEERIAAGESTVGFVNPTLYSNPQVLRDITTGDNPGCNTNGFSAVKGWDPVTGLGTPNYPAMLKLFMSL